MDELLAVLLSAAVVGLIAWVLRPDRKNVLPSVDVELEIVLTAAIRLAIVEHAAEVTCGHFVRASLLSEAVASSLRGEAPQPLVQCVIPPSEPPAFYHPRISPVLQGVLDAAPTRAAKAKTRLHAVLLGLRSGPDPTAAKLLGVVDFDRLGPNLAHPIVELHGDEVFIVDDDVTKMEEVTDLLEAELGFEHLRAAFVMLTVHHRGSAVVGRGATCLARLRDAATAAGLTHLVITDQRPVPRRRAS